MSDRQPRVFPSRALLEELGEAPAGRVCILPGKGG